MTNDKISISELNIKNEEVRKSESWMFFLSRLSPVFLPIKFQISIKFLLLCKYFGFAL